MDITNEHVERFKNLTISSNKKAKKKVLSANFIYKIPQLPLNAIVGELQELSDKELQEFEKKELYGLNFFTLFVLNKDPEVLKFILQLFKDRGLKFSKIENKAINTTKYTIYEGDTPMNIALQQASIEKIKVLVDYGYPMLTENQLLEVSYRDRIKCQNLFELCATYAAIKHSEKQMSFYLDFALSHKTYEEYNIKIGSDGAHMLALLLYPKLYGSAKFQEDIIEILSKTKKVRDSRVFISLNLRLMGREKYEVIDNIMKYTPHLVQSEEFLNSCKNFMKENMSYKGEKLYAAYEAKLQILYEKNLMNKTLEMGNSVKKAKSIKI